MHTVTEVRRIYSRTASYYDAAVRFFPVMGVRLDTYRRHAVAALNLRPGATVVELGCGTGLNLPRLQDAVGSGGRVIGVDVTTEMLRRAQQRIDRHGWSNVRLVHCDVADYTFPTEVDAITSTYALTLSPRFDDVIRNGAAALARGGRFVILDLKQPESWPTWLVRFAAWLNRPFAVTLDLAERHPWEVLRACLREVEYREYYFGALYLCAAVRD